jgi:hypothetical protein
MDQSADPGRWVTLGAWRLEDRGVVSLDAHTGELAWTKRRFAFDAVRFVPTGLPTPARERAGVGREEPSAAPTPGVPAQEPEPRPEEGPVGIGNC